MNNMCYYKNISNHPLAPCTIFSPLRSIGKAISNCIHLPKLSKSSLKGLSFAQIVKVPNLVPKTDQRSRTYKEKTFCLSFKRKSTLSKIPSSCSSKTRNIHTPLSPYKRVIQRISFAFSCVKIKETAQKIKKIRPFFKKNVEKAKVIKNLLLEKYSLHKEKISSIIRIAAVTARLAGDLLSQTEKFRELGLCLTACSSCLSFAEELQDNQGTFDEF